MQRHTFPDEDNTGIQESGASLPEEESCTLVSDEGEQQIEEEQQEVEANQLIMTNANMSQLSCECEECLQEIARERKERDQLRKVVTGVREELNFQKKQLSMLDDHTKPIPLPPIRVSHLRSLFMNSQVSHL